MTKQITMRQIDVERIHANRLLDASRLENKSDDERAVLRLMYEAQIDIIGTMLRFFHRAIDEAAKAKELSLY